MLKKNKENSCWHSEKLSMAFGLNETPTVHSTYQRQATSLGKILFFQLILPKITYKETQ